MLSHNVGGYTDRSNFTDHAKPCLEKVATYGCGAKGHTLDRVRVRLNYAAVDRSIAPHIGQS